MSEAQGNLCRLCFSYIIHHLMSNPSDVFGLFSTLIDYSYAILQVFALSLQREGYW